MFDAWQFPTLTWGDPTLPSALRRFTSEFGMGSGGTTALVPPGKFFVLLQTMVKEGTFREDLFYRLNVIHLTLPPLRERREDIALLANHFLQKFSSENQRDIIEIDPTAMSILTAWPWPGNIRELSNVIERAVVMNTGAVISADDLPDPFRNPVNAMTETKPTYSGERNLKEEIKREEKRIILEVLDNQDGNRTRTALMLGISRRALMYKLQEYGIDPSGS